MLYALIAWSWIKSFWQITLLPLVAKIPWQLWAALAVIIGFFYYGHVRESRALKECYAKVEQAKDLERRRQQEVSDKVVADAKQAEAEAQQEAGDMKERLDHALEDVAKLKEANRICLPKSVTDQFGRVRKPRRK